MSESEEDIRICPTDDTVLNYLEEKYPGILIAKSPQYSVDIMKFNHGWAMCCVTMKCEPKCVILLRDTYIPLHRTTHKLLAHIIKTLIILGYSVVDCNNFDVCSTCNEIIVNRQRVEGGGFVFSGKCQSCLQKK